MKIEIRKPVGYTQQGRKDQQEDAVWPDFEEVSVDNTCIVLCDGVGGSAHGEVASQTSSKVVGEYLTKIIAETNTVTEENIQEAVNLAYDELEKIDNEPAEKGVVSMATTLTCVCIYDDGILAAHMGDSRIYHIRPGIGLQYQSNDHSLVNALLEVGEITLEEAKTFPRKNVITRAIQPHVERRSKAEVVPLTDLQSGDYVFLCCDGVLEQLTNERLIEILSMDCSDEEKRDLLEAESTGRTRDNYTAYLIPIDKVEGKSSIIQEDEVCSVIVEEESPEEMDTQEPHQESTQASTPTPIPEPVPEPVPHHHPVINKTHILYAIIALLAICAAFLLGKLSSKGEGEKEPSRMEIRRIIRDQVPKKKPQSSVKTKASKKKSKGVAGANTEANKENEKHSDSAPAEDAPAS